MFSGKAIQLEALISFHVAITTCEAITNPHIRCSAIKAIAFFTPQTGRTSSDKSVENS